MAKWFNPLCLFKKFLTKRQYGSTHIVSFKLLIKIQYGQTDTVFEKKFYRNTIWLNSYCVFQKVRQRDNMVEPYSLLTKFSAKDNMVQLILSFKKNLTKRQYGLTHVIILENFDQKTLRFNQYCLFQNF